MNKLLIEEIRELYTIVKRNVERENEESFTEAKHKIKNYTQLQIVTFLFNNRKKKICQKDICEAINMKKSSVTEHLDYLESVELINRISDEKDNRKKIIVLSDKSVSSNKYFIKTKEEINSKMLKDISEDEIIAFKKTIKKIKTNLIGDDK